MTDDQHEDQTAAGRPEPPEDGLDQEIALLLAVDPSPEFLARIRARVDAEPQPRPWWTGWVPVSAAVGATALLVLVVLGPRLAAPERPSGERLAMTMAPANTSAAPPAATRDSVVTAADARPTPAMTTPEADTSPPPPSEPRASETDPGADAARQPPAVAPDTVGPLLARVVISRNEAAALRRLFSQVQTQQIPLPPPRPPSGPIAPLDASTDLTIRPIAIEPLTVALLDEGAM